nr:lipocalin family protein [Paraburkholderia sp. BL17N1]
MEQTHPGRIQLHNRKGSPRTALADAMHIHPANRTRLPWHQSGPADDQELDSRQSTGAVYWEGAVRVSREGVDAGRAYLELTGYADAWRMERE